MLRERFSPASVPSVCTALWRLIIDSTERAESGTHDPFVPTGESMPLVPTLQSTYGGHAVPPIPRHPERLIEWAAAQGVSEALNDPFPREAIRHRSAGWVAPPTVREAFLRVATTEAGGGNKPRPRPTFEEYQKAIERQQVMLANQWACDYLAMTAGISLAWRERQARVTVWTSNPVLEGLTKVVRRMRDEQREVGQTRKRLDFVPIDIQLIESDPPVVAYFERSMADLLEGRSETIPALHLNLGAWETGQLVPRCLRCDPSEPCPHLLSACEELLAVLGDAESPVSVALAAQLGVPAWRRFLDGLDKKLGHISPAEAEDERLLWEIEVENELPVLHPVLQKQGKRGAWGKGKRVRIQRLQFDSTLLATAADRAVFDLLFAIDAGPRDRQTDARKMWRALFALLGASNVVLAGDRANPVTVRQARLRLDFEDTDAGFVPLLKLGSARIDPARILAAAPDGRHLAMLNEPGTHCYLVLVEPEVKALIESMGRHPALLPLPALDDLIVRLPRMQHGLDLHLPESVRGDRVDPTTSIVCRIEPLPEQGLRVGMVVRPIPEGPVFPPGEGPPEILHIQDGRRVHAARPFSSEVERGQHLAREVGLMEEMALGSWTWEVDDDAVALGILTALKERPSMALLEWPKGEITVGRLGRAALKVDVTQRLDWFSAEGGAEIDESKVSLAELLAAVRGGRRFVKMGERRFALLEEELRERLAALDDVAFVGPHGVEIGLPAAPVLANLVEEQRQLTAAPAFRSILESLGAATVSEPLPPESFKATLRPYQLEGYRWLCRLADWGLGACLADDMGLGKTVQALALLANRSHLGPTLVVAPTSVVANWASEAQAFAPGLRARIYRGPHRLGMLAGLGAGDVLVASYAVTVRDAEVLKGIDFATLIVDEAQMVKNALTHRFKAVRDLRAGFRVALTGTPIENHLGELWAIFRLVTPGLLGSWEQFRTRFALPIERSRDKGRQAALGRVLRPFILRRTKSEVAPELPPRTEMNQQIELGPTERRLYEAARFEALARLARVAAAREAGKEDNKERIRILADITRLRLLCCHPRLVVEGTTAGSSKLAALVELALELRDEGHRVLVFSQFKSFLDLARPLLANAGLRSLTIDGSTPGAEREQIVRSFQAGEADVFLLSLRAGGMGLNLTRATYVIHLDPWWNPAVEDQATDRAHRIGQEHPVTVIRMVARGTIEEAVLSLHAQKRELAASILDGADSAGTLDSNELIDLIRKGGSDGDEDFGEGEGEVDGEAPGEVLGG